MKSRSADTPRPNFHYDKVTAAFLRESRLLGLTRPRNHLHTLVWRQSLSLLHSYPDSALSAPDHMTPIGPVGQIGILVADIVAASDHYQRIFGVTEWRRYTYGPGFVPDLWYRGRPTGFSMHIALGGTGPQLELIEPLAAPSIYHEHIRAHGYGIHHLGVFVASLDEAITTMTAHGYELIQYGRGYGLDGDGGFAYFDTSHDHHTTIEAIEVPRRRRAPLVSWAQPRSNGGNTST